VNATGVPPLGFDDRHFRLAADYGISRERILFVRSLDEMRSEARRLGVSDAESERYGEHTWGLSIQRDDIPGGPDVFIVLKGPLTEDVQIATYRRLSAGELDPSPRILATDEPDFLYGFLLLHEIAHHVLAHGGREGAWRDVEDEADRWAYAELCRGGGRPFERPIATPIENR